MFYFMPFSSFEEQASFEEQSNGLLETFFNAFKQRLLSVLALSGMLLTTENCAYYHSMKVYKEVKKIIGKDLCLEESCLADPALDRSSLEFLRKEKPTVVSEKTRNEGTMAYMHPWYQDGRPNEYYSKSCSLAGCITVPPSLAGFNINNDLELSVHGLKSSFFHELVHRQFFFCHWLKNDRL